MRLWKAVIVAAAAVALTCKILLALDTFGTNDVYAFERFARWSRIFGADLYSIDPAFNHPPFMIHALRALMWFASATGIAFPFWLRLPAILADAGSVYVVYRLFADRFDEPLIRWGLLLLAVSPTLILVSGFHGNTDSVVMFFVLLSILLTEKGADDWKSGAAFGAALCIKILPVILLPAFLLYRPGARRRLIFLALVGAVILMLWSPYLFLNPKGIFTQVLGYKSLYGHWGIGWMVYRFFPLATPAWHEAFYKWGAWILIAIITAIAIFVNRRPEKPSLYAQCGASLFLFLAAGNGFGVQYLAWLAPWIVGIAFLPAAFFTVASGVFLFLTYNYWAGGFPWYLADANYVGDYSPHLDYFLGMCWISVIVLAIAAWKWRTPAFPGWRANAAFCAAAIILITHPASKQLRADARTYPPSVDHAAIATVHAGEQAALSDQYFTLGRYTDAVVAARTGAALDPSVFQVWNSLARACMKMERWDEAQYAANNAYLLAPDDETANANMAELQSRR